MTGRCSRNARHAQAVTIECGRCKRVLCFWHFSLEPEQNGQRVKLVARCHPDCSHDFDSPEVRA
jgi:hypothetical protein